MVPKLKSQRSAQSFKKKSGSASSYAASRTAPNKPPNKQKNMKVNSLIFEEDGLLDGTEVTYFSDGKPLLKGYKAGSGIFCYCCLRKTSPSGFENHAFSESGNNPHKKPYYYIQLDNGQNLQKANMYLKVRSAKENGNSSADGEKGLLCEDCRSFFHKDSASLPMNTPAKYQCGFCLKECIEQKSYASEHPIIKTDECATCAVGKNEETPTVCALTECSGYKNCDCEFGPLALITCVQCEKQFHVGCLKEHGKSNLKEKPRGNWFCSFDCDSACKNIFSTLERLIPESLKEDDGDENIEGSFKENIGCRLLCAKSTHNDDKLLSDATSIFYENFGRLNTAVSDDDNDDDLRQSDDTVIQSDDLIRDMVYGKRGQNRRMYCAAVTVGSTVVAAGLFRVLGQDFAELPLAATAKAYQRKGYLRRLISYLEDLLLTLNVRSLVLPATEGSTDMWKEKFGFLDMSLQQKETYQQNCWNMLTFRDAFMLQKLIPKKSEDIE